MLLFICVVTQNVRSESEQSPTAQVLFSQHSTGRFLPLKFLCGYFSHIKMKELDRKCGSVVFLGYGRARGCGNGEGYWSLQLQPQTDQSAPGQTRLKAQTCKQSGKLSCSSSALTSHQCYCTGWNIS